MNSRHDATGNSIAISAGLLAGDTLPLTLRAKGLRLEPAGGGWHLTIGLLNADAEVATHMSRQAGCRLLG